MNDLARYLEIWSGYLEHGVERVVDDFSEDVTWEEYRDAPGAETWHGRAGVLALNRRWEEDFDDFHFQPTGAPVELAPGTFAIPVLVQGRGRGSGIEIDWNIFMVAELRDGLVARAFYADTLEEARERLASA